MTIDQAIEELLSLKRKHPGIGSHQIADDDGEAAIVRFYLSDVDTEFGEIAYVAFETSEWLIERDEDDEDDDEDEDDDWLDDDDEEDE